MLSRRDASADSGVKIVAFLVRAAMHDGAGHPTG